MHFLKTIVLFFSTIYILLHFFLFNYVVNKTFRALRTKGKTPKHGLIFHSSFIGRATGRNKGRIARFLASKCSIAARVDYFGGKVSL